MKIICVGRNYEEHIKELGNEKPKDIVFFLKPDSALLRNDEDFYYPDYSKKIDYETEIVVKINALGKCIPKDYAKNYYSEIALGLDLTLRDKQEEAKQKSLPWTLSKGFDYSAPISKFYCLRSINKDVQDINFSLKKNGVVVQEANTKQMINSVDEIIAYVSKYMTLKIGDLIFTGTPKGVSQIKVGDILEGYIEKEKVLTTKIK